MNRRAFLASLAASAVVAPFGAAMAGTPVVYAPGGVALGGVDPVAYFTEGRPVSGSAQYALMWMGATWLFASAENRATFETDPHRFAPAFGGYCSYAVSRGYTASSDPEAFAIYNGRLYLIHSAKMRTLWQQDRDGNIALGQSHWPDVLR